MLLNFYLFFGTYVPLHELLEAVIFEEYQEGNIFDYISGSRILHFFYIDKQIFISNLPAFTVEVYQRGDDQDSQQIFMIIFRRFC